MKLNYYLGNLALAACVLSAGGPVISRAADITIVESRAGGQNVAWYSSSTGWSDSTAKSSAAGVTPGIGSRFSTAVGASFSVSPVLLDGATYAIDITHGESSSITSPIDIGVTATGGTLDVTNTGVFARFPQNVWERVGTITLELGVTTPTITFTKLVGTGRFYADAVRFTLFEPCLAVPALTTVNGPLAAGQTYVDVPMTNTAQAITVYANGVKIGEKTSSVIVGMNRVTTSALVQGQVIGATQTENGVEGCVPTTGQSVGSGPNAPIGLAISIRQTNLTSSTIGINGGTPGSILKLIGATGTVATLEGPLGYKVFYPSNEWQSVQFQRGDDPANPIDPTYNWNVADPTFGNQLAYNFGVFDSLVFTVNGDTGPFAIYIDEFRNGDTLIQGFEGAALGANGTATFQLPGTSGTHSKFLLAQSPGTLNPNLAMVTNNTTDAGAQSLLLSFQFNSTNRANCTRVAAVVTGTGNSPNPIVDLRLPISFRMLILPVGAEPPPMPAIATTGPANQRVIRGGTATMRFTHGGTPPLSFLWRRNGQYIPGATNATLTLTNVQVSDAGAYSAEVYNSLGSGESTAGTLTVEDVPYSDIMTPAWRLTNGTRPYLANDGNTRSIAFNPMTTNVLLVSRSGQATNVYVLDGETGAFRHTLTPPPGGYVDGVFTLNQVAVANDGTVYAGNLTDNGVNTEFKLYRWFSDSDTDVADLIWHGNPSQDGTIPLRWGDTMVVRGDSGSHEIILSSRTGQMLSFIYPDFGNAVAVNVAGAPDNGLRLGLAVESMNRVWAKMTSSPLLQIDTDPSIPSATVINSITGLGNMGPIGINTSPIGAAAAGTLLAGVFIDNPDHIRLFDISNPAQPIALDTEFFPTDNANGNASGGVAFGIDKVYALDSNNGIIAMNLNTACLPDVASIERSGSDVIIRWNRPSFRLEGTTSIGGTWGQVATTSPATVNASTGMQFFRLVCP